MLVVSGRLFSEVSGLAFVCPITNRVRPLSTSALLPAGLPIAGDILPSHLRCIDILARPVRYAGVAAPPETAAMVRVKLITLVRN